MEEFREHIPIVQTLFNPGLRDRHWDNISEVIGFPIKPDETSCLSKFVDMNLEPYILKFESISEAASKEYALEKALDGMKNEWCPVSLCFLLFWHAVPSKLSLRLTCNTFHDHIFVCLLQYWCFAFSVTSLTCSFAIITINCHCNIVLYSVVSTVKIIFMGIYCNTVCEGVVLTGII